MLGPSKDEAIIGAAEEQIKDFTAAFNSLWEIIEHYDMTDVVEGSAELVMKHIAYELLSAKRRKSEAQARISHKQDQDNDAPK